MCYSSHAHRNSKTECGVFRCFSVCQSLIIEIERCVNSGYLFVFARIFLFEQLKFQKKTRTTEIRMNTGNQKNAIHEFSKLNQQNK